MLKKTLKIIPYFGKLPPMWPYYLDSLKRNQFLHLLFVTDIVFKDKLPENITILKYSLSDFFQLVENKLKIKISESAKIPYKICELKPAMGFLFSDYIKDYEYWAYGDIDLIYGNLPRFLKKPFAENADVISFREDWLSGAFTIIKNKPLLNNLFLESSDLEKVINNPKCQNFDECGRKYGFLREGMSPEEALNLKIENDVVCWTTLIHRLADKNEIKLFTREYIKESLPWGEIIDFRNGKIIAAEATEYAIYHFVHHKRFKSHYIPQLKIIPDYYYISPTGIYNKRMLKHYHTIDRYRKFKGFFLTLKQRLIASYNYRIRKKISA
ncbi:MAG: hypothetical protein PHT69_03880 [Bacteroidales bacterium]|nr:hypothetical protein [Bacteroidales bacterium]